MKGIKQWLTAAATILLVSLAGCSEEEKPTPEPEPVISRFAKGADVSWITEMERSGKKFYDFDGKESDGITLMKQLGLNSIRLRVWVDPADGWCSPQETLVKAIRAHRLGMRILVDFHYSDSWADPGQQNKPKAWEGLSTAEIAEKLAEHTRSTLQLLKDNGITPEWVQVGNETNNGMLWEEGKEPAIYALYNNAGYDAVKTVFPNAKVMVHLHNGFDNALYRWFFDRLRANGGKWDMIGMSLYPSAADWKKKNEQCLANILDMISRYDTETMVCEVGMPWDDAASAKAFLVDLIAKTKGVTEDKCAGVFYWEPQAYNNWKGYSLGAFANDGKPTAAMEAFAD